MVCHLVSRHKIIRTECKSHWKTGRSPYTLRIKIARLRVKHKITRLVSEFSLDDQICVVFTGVFLISVSRLPNYRYNALIFYVCAYAYITISLTGILSQRDSTLQFDGEFSAKKICFIIKFFIGLDKTALGFSSKQTSPLRNFPYNWNVLANSRQ